MARRFFGFFQGERTPFAEQPGASAWRPNTDIYRTREGWLIKFDLAGVKPEDVVLTRRGQVLSVRGSRRDWCLEDGCHCYQLEIAYSQFEREVTLPADLARARIEAEHRHGMLLVRIHLEDDSP